MVFSRKPGYQKKDLLDLPKLMMKGEELSFVDETKCLGVTFDTQLNWNSHLNNKINKCKKDLMSIKT